MKLWIVTAVDHGDSCDGKARTLGLFKTEAEARSYVNNDMCDYIDNNTSDTGECPFIADFAAMSIVGSIDPDFGCEWNIEEVDFN